MNFPCNFFIAETNERVYKFLGDESFDDPLINIFLKGSLQ